MKTRCEHCGDRFRPRPNVAHQRYCSREECQEARKREWRKGKLRTDEAYRDNPVRAKMVKRLIDYRWSSYPVYAYGKKGPEWLKTDLILSYFGSRGGHKSYRGKAQNYAGEAGRP